MKKLLLAAALTLSALTAHADLTATDVKGRTVTVPKVPERVVLGFYYEDYLAIGGKDAMDKVVALALSTWKDWRPQQYALYEKALPKLKDIPDIGNTEDGTFPSKRSSPPTPISSSSAPGTTMPSANRSNNLTTRASLTSSLITTRKPWINTLPPPLPSAPCWVRKNVPKNWRITTKTPSPILKNASRR